MKLIAPNVGWATTANTAFGATSPEKLFWTADGGAHWRDITPNPFVNSEAQKIGKATLPYGAELESINDVFFLDTHRGWVLFCCSYPRTTKSPNGELPYFDLAMTTDAGATWSIAGLTTPEGTSLPPLDSGLSAKVEFADSLHGWINLIGCATHSCEGTLLTTSDGGRTWRAPSDYVSANPFNLVGPNEAWQLSLPGFFDDEGELNVTREGAKSWQKVSVPYPKEKLSAAGASELPPTVFFHDLPTFEDSKHGFLPVTYLAEKAEGNSAIVLFETLNGGQTWKPIRAITNLYIPGVNATYVVAIADSTLIAATVSKDDQHATLSTDGPAGRTDTDISSYTRRAPGLSFATPKQGWMLGNGLASTTDGGVTWTALTPGVDQQKTAAAPLPPSVVNSMHLLTPDIGWASSFQGALYWTEDGGNTWKTITPPDAGEFYKRLNSVFFLDAKRGWVVFNTKNTLIVSSTTDAGAQWSSTSVDVPGLQAGLDPLSLGGQISFTDSLHGWINFVAMYSLRDVKNGILVTSDGGRTWRPAPSDNGLMGYLRFATPMDGWMLVPGTDELYVTHDGAKSWDKVSLPPPKEAYGTTQATYELPSFEDSKHGFLPVTYSGGLSVKAVAVLFVTEDAGQTWKPDRILANLKPMPVGNRVASAMAGPAWVAANVSGDGNPAITTVASGATVNSSSNANPGYYGARQLSFVSPTRGWVLLNDLRFLSTTDGGASWVEMSARAGFQSTRSDVRVVESMQMLSPDIGWAVAQGRFYWTESGGADWNTVSQSGLTQGQISSAFFLDTRQGWALSCAASGLVVFSTTNAGANWSITNVDIPGVTGNKSDCQISFADSLHGWISLDSASGSNVLYTKTLATSVLVTSDGGRTWNPTSNDVGTMGDICFVTPMDGWMVVPPNDELYVTRDGAKSWTKVSLLPPKEVYPANEATYDLPTFEDSKHGFLPVTYSGALGVKAAAVLFVTEDGGQTWKPDRMLTDLNGLPVGNRVASTVLGSDWIIANLSNDTSPTLTTIASGATVTAGSNAAPGHYGAVQLSFVTPTRGWVLLNDGRVLSTIDGGASWSDLDFSPSVLSFARHKASRPLWVVSMQLVGPEVGVATLGNGIIGQATEFHLMRTETGGAHWKEISPPLTTSDKMVAPFFFLDATHGWMVSWHRGPEGPEGKPESGPIFELVSTADAGTTWSRAHIDIPELALQSDSISPIAQISFVDSLHGWLDLTISIASNPKFHWRKMFITADGGKSWNQVPNSPIEPAAVRFVTPTEGWLVGNPPTPAATPTPALDARMGFLRRRGMPNPESDAQRYFRRYYGVLTGPPVQMAPGNSHGGQAGEELYVTRDGAKSWQVVSLEIPKDVYSPDGSSYTASSKPGCTVRYPDGVLTDADTVYPPPSAIYELPTFTNGEHGLLPVAYTAISGVRGRRAGEEMLLSASTLFRGTVCNRRRRQDMEAG